MPQKICSECKGTILSFHDLYVCCQETTDKFVHLVKSKTREPDKKASVVERSPNGKGNSFFSEDDDNDNFGNGSALKNVEMLLANEAEDAVAINSTNTMAMDANAMEQQEQAVGVTTKDAPEKSIKDE